MDINHSPSVNDSGVIRAFSLLSGGLDSQLAVCVLKDQGIEVHGITFESPFFSAAHARTAAQKLGIPLHVVDFTTDIIELIGNPKHGFGSHMNPCIDCHGRMLNRAGKLMQEMGFHFLSTGEVLNERPMSQNRNSLKVVAEMSGYSGLIVRPLSAKLLPETEPEQKGWVSRDRLLALQGRSRDAQFKLAERYGLKDYPTPAGGCRLTEPNYAKRLRDLKEHEGMILRDINLLRVGRHFRLAEKLKLIVGRNKDDNAQIRQFAETGDIVLNVEDVPGPTALLPPTATEAQILQAAAICARYGDLPAGQKARIKVRSTRGEHILEVLPAPAGETESLRI